MTANLLGSYVALHMSCGVARWQGGKVGSDVGATAPVTEPSVVAGSLAHLCWREREPKGPPRLAAYLSSLSLEVAAGGSAPSAPTAEVRDALKFCC